MHNGASSASNTLTRTKRLQKSLGRSIAHGRFILGGSTFWGLSFSSTTDEVPHGCCTGQVIGYDDVALSDHVERA